MNKNNLRTVAEHTIGVLDHGYYHNGAGERVDIGDQMRRAVEGTVLYTPQELSSILDGRPAGGSHTTNYEVRNETTLDAARRLPDDGYGNVLCLNFASAKNPGGGFLGGASAQEESLARSSGLYSCLLKAPEYYAFHRGNKSCLYSDHMIYSPDVPVFKLEDGSPMNAAVPVSFITSAAVNAGVVEAQEPENIGRIVPVMRSRIDKMFALCAARGHKTLVLGAWGCGVFRNDPAVIARMFGDALEGEFKGIFRTVVFAVRTNNEKMIRPFAIRFATDGRP